jgi:hypothetical protein
MVQETEAHIGFGGGWFLTDPRPYNLRYPGSFYLLSVADHATLQVSAGVNMTFMPAVEASLAEDVRVDCAGIDGDVPSEVDTGPAPLKYGDTVPLPPRRKVPMSPRNFAARCEHIVGSMRGHAAHRALDLLTNELLNSLGYSAGISIFEAAVALWHSEAHQYPYSGPCPACELI